VNVSHKKGSSMLYEFAMTPNVFDASNLEKRPGWDTKLIEILKGICDNGLLANLNKGDLFHHVMEDILPGLPIGVQSDVKRLLNTLYDRHRIVRFPRSGHHPERPEEWLSEILKIHNKSPFCGVFLTRDLLPPDGYPPELIDLTEALNSEPWLKRSRTVIIRKKEEDYENILRPLLRHAKTLSLIDPYLSCLPRFMKTVSLCVKLLGKRIQDVMPGRIHIHAGNPEKIPGNNEPVPNRLDTWERKLLPIVSAYPHRVEVFLWNIRIGREDFHDRFVITDQCGISVPGGLDCKPTTSTTWSLLDEDVRRYWLGFYDPLTSPYELLGRRSIGPAHCQKTRSV